MIPLVSYTLRTLLACLIVLAIAPIAAARDADSKYAAFYQQETANLPGQCVQLIDCSKLADFDIPNDANGKGQVVDVDGEPFGKAIRVDVPHPVTPLATVQLQTPANVAAVKKNDTLFVEYNVRCTQSTAESGGGFFLAYLQSTTEPRGNTGSFSAAPGNKWLKGYGTFVSHSDYPPGKLLIAFQLGQYTQTLEIGGLVVVDLGQNVDASRLPVTRITYVGREPDAPWRKEAQERINKYRKGDLTVKVTDSAGKPMAGVPVHIRMIRHAYQFGTFIENPARLNDADGQKYQEYLLKWFNRATVPLYWTGWAKTSGEDYLERARWAVDHFKYVRGHNIIWPAWRTMPAAVRADKNDPAKLTQAINDHIDDIVNNFRQFNFTDYDVVNETRTHHDITDILGTSVLADWFKRVKKLDPRPLLAINEFAIIAGGGWTTKEQDLYFNTIQSLLDQGAPVEEIGLQCHLNEDLTPPARIVEILDRFAKFKLPIQATEFDINAGDEEVQADYLRDFYTAFFSHPATTGITMWGFWEGRQWIPRAALIRKDWTLKPNGRVYEDLVLGKWWTDVQVKTGADGAITIRGFKGDYLITTQTPAGEVKATTELGETGTATLKF
jgi:endo-1,4-beta-xylanase